MSTIHPGQPRDAADESPFTVEDAGSTSDPADLVGGERARQGDAAFADDDAVAAGGGSAGTRVTSTEELPVADAPSTGGGAHVATAADTSSDTPAGTSAGSSPKHAAPSIAALDDDGSIAHVFDQTNGVIEGIDGESDGTAAGDEEPPEGRGAVPIGQQDAFREDHYGADDGRDRNP